MDATAFFGKLKPLAGRIPFAKDALAAFYCATDPKTPTYVRATILGALAYFVAPVDAIPDFIAALGYTDDAAVLLAVMKSLGANLKPEHEDRARNWLGMPPARMEKSS